MQAPKDAIVIDGSEGEGGGQILRTSLALSLITGRAFHLVKLRARRHKPGLLRQHLTAVRAATSVGGAKVQGDALGSQELVFVPGPVKHGEYTFSVGSAGSVTLVLQTVIWPLLHAQGTSQLHFEGGTHNPMAPPFEFIAEVFLPLLRRMGAQVEATLEKVGFYPAGGGRFTAKISGGQPLQAIDWLERGQLVRRRARAIYANLPKSIADRELRAVQNLLGWERQELRAMQVESAGPGNALLLSVEFEHGTELFSAFGEKRISAEQVAARVVKEMREHMDSPAPVGPHLADQLLIPLALAGRGSFRSYALTQHTLTNMDIVSRFLPVRFDVGEETNDARTVTVHSK